MKRILSLLLTLIVCFTLINAEIYSGSCGENLTWSLNTEDSTLTMEGSGFMYTSSPWSAYRSYIYYANLPEGLRNIGYHSFEQCSNLRYIKIPDSVESIDQTAFWLCTSLTSIEIPDNVNRIDQLAFINCTNLQTVIIGSSVSMIDRWAFSGCEKLNTIVCKSTTPPELGSDVFQAIDLSKISLYVPAESLLAYQEADQWNSCNIYTCIASGTCGDNGDNVQWSLYSDGNIIISGNGKMADYELEDIPWTQYRENITTALIVDGVTRLGNYAFNSCYNLTSVTIYRTLNEFGDYAFGSGGSLTAVYILDLEQWCKINFSTFYCNPLYAAQHLYLNGSEITGELGIPNTVVNIGTWAFVNCKGITSVVVPEGVESIGQGSFNSSNISQISFPSSLTTIGWASFLGCENLSNLSFPDNVTTIDEYAFRNCTGLKSVTIGEGVESIGNWAFSGCSGLESVNVLAATAPSLGSSAFYECSSLTTINYPCGSSESYESAWSEYSSYLIENCEVAEITAKVDPQNPGIYYSTFYDGSSNYKLPMEGVEAYVATISGDYMNMTRIAGDAGVIPQGTAVILKSTIQNYTLTSSNEAPDFDVDNILEGVDEATNTPANCYVLSAVDGAVGFYQYTGDQVAAHKAYLIYSPNSSNPAPRRLRFVYDQATGIEDANAMVNTNKVLRDGQLIIIRNGVEYNANGQMIK